MRAAGCETDEQGLGVLGVGGLAATARDRRFREERKVLGQRRHCSGGPQQFICWRECRHSNAAVGTTQVHIILVSPRSERLGSPTPDFTYSSFICI